LSDIICWEALDSDDPALAAARRLYESAIEPAERIPWRWLESAVRRRRGWRPGEWSPHLLLAGGRRGSVAALAYGAHVPDFGGYACYLAVEPRRRRHGLGSRLLRLLMDVLRVDAAFEGVELPFVVWESHEPGPAAGEKERALWQARLRLFERVGARRVDGLTFFAPNFERRGGEPLPLRLFLVPRDRPAEAFDAAALRAVAAGLLEEVYGREPGDPLHRLTLPPDCAPVLRPVTTPPAATAAGSPPAD
jgi:GNAT superfamily N-acetyltransferase